MHPAVTRHIKTIATTGAALALALGTALPALAAPPGGQGNGTPPTTPPGQAKQTASPTPAATHVAPGQATKPSPAPNAKGGNGKGKGKGANHAGGNGMGNNGAGSGHNPPGNNGTVKIHSVADDSGHHNVAHVGCSFVVDFWGFDQDQTLTVSFTGQAPTGNGTPLTLDAPDGTSITSPDPAGGGNDPDGELAFTATTADLSVLGAPAHEGYHVRLTVDTGQGGGHKYKVFWITPCTESITSTGTTIAPTTSVAPTESPTLSTDTPTVSVGQFNVGQFNAARRSVAAATPTAQLEARRLNQASPPISSLPFTGADISGMIAAGLMLGGAGVVLTVAARNRRRHKIG